MMETSSQPPLTPLPTVRSPRPRALNRSEVGAFLRSEADRILPLLAGLLVLISLFLPYWRMNMHAPQYPDGLFINIYPTQVTGDVREIDGLNHYIGMKPLDEGGELERTLAWVGIPLLAVGTALIALRRRRIWLLAIPLVALPIVFAADLSYWLYDFGHNLDPTAALSSSIDEFTPPLLFNGLVGQFETTAYFYTGYYLVIAAIVMVAAALWIRRRRGAAP